MEVGGQLHDPAALPVGKEHRYLLNRTGWAPEPVWHFGKEEIVDLASN